MHVLITDWDYPDLSIEQEIFEAAGVKLSEAHCKTEDEIVQVLQSLHEKVDALLIQYASVGKKVLDAAPSIGFLGRYGIGYDSVDVQAATERGAVVVNVPDYCIHEVAEHAMALMLAASRRIVALNNAIRSGTWDVIKTAGGIREMHGETLGLVGAGRIGRNVAQRAQAFGMRVIAHDPPLPQHVAEAAGITLVSLETLLEESDFISLHAPLSSGTRHLIGAEELAQMNSHAWLINTSRGGLIDTAALVEALHAGKIGGAALDVLEKEPIPSDSPLLDAPNVILTPHAAWYSQGSAIRLRRNICEEVLRWQRGEKLRSPINPESLQQQKA